MAFVEPPDNGDIRATLALGQVEAQSGSSRTLNLPGGRQVVVNIPAGIQNGQEMRLAGQGEALWPGGPAGDLILTISVAPAPIQAPSNPGMNEFSPTEYISAPSFQPPVSAPNYPPAAGGGNPYTAYPVQPNYTATTPAGQGSYPNYAPQTQAAQEPVYLPQTVYQPPQNQTAYQAPQSYAGYQQPVQAGAPMYTPPPQRKRRVSPAVVTIIIVLVLLLLAGSGLIYYVGVYQPKVQHDQATATAQGQLTATANAQSSATAVARATANAQASATANAQATVNAQASATATAYQSILTSATSGTPALNDALSAQSGSNWDMLLPANSSVAGSCQFLNNAYHSNMPTKGYFQPCYAENPGFTNFAFQIQMTITQGDEGGILFRADPNNSKYYLFRITVNGAYDLFLYTSGQANSAQRLLNNSASSFHTGLNQLNTIALVAQGSNLYFYINNQFIDSTNNSGLTSGKIGVFGESGTNPTDVAFVNAKVWQI